MYKNSIGKAHFTGDEIRELLGYQLVVIGIQDDSQYGIVEFYTDTIFETEQLAIEYLQGLVIPETYKPFVSRYPLGELHVNVQ